MRRCSPATVLSSEYWHRCDPSIAGGGQTRNECTVLQMVGGIDETHGPRCRLWQPALEAGAPCSRVSDASDSRPLAPV